MESKEDKSITRFNGERYAVWKFRVLNLMRDRKVIEVIKSEPPEPVTRKWEKKNQKAKTIIIQHLADSFLSYAQDELSAKEIIDKMDSVYFRKSTATQIVLKRKLLNTKLQNEMSLNSHFIIIEEMISELVAAGARVDESDKIAYLTISLPKIYDGIITAIEAQAEDNITLSFVKNKLIDYETKIKREQSDTSAKVLQINRFDEHKYLKKTFNKTNFKRNQNNKKKFKCYHCGKLGHFKNNCYEYKKQMNNKNEKSVQLVQQKQPQQEEAQTSGYAFMMSCMNFQPNEFIIDSGASDHLINNIKFFESYIDLKEPIKIAVAKNNTYIMATKLGIVKLKTDENIPLVLQDVLYCEEVPNCLMSVRKMQKAGLTIEFNEYYVKVSKSGKKIFKCNVINGLPTLKFNDKIYMAEVNINFSLWHKRLGHLSSGKFSEILRQNLYGDNEILKGLKINNEICEGCLKGKQTRLKYAKEKCKEHITRPLFIVHTDVCGPITPSTVDGKNYYVIFVDQYTHYCVTYLLARKSDVFNVFKDFVAKAEAHFNLKMVNLYSDNGGEYISNEMKDFCKEKGISFHLTVPHSPQQNGVAERMIRYLTETARAMVHSAEMNKSFWGEAVLTATYLINRRPTRSLKQLKTPFELWHNKKPLLKYLRVFGSTVFVHNKTKETKFDSKIWKGILVGYEPNGYKIWNVETGKFATARDVVVDETSFMQTRPVGKSEEVLSEQELFNQLNDKYDMNVKESIQEISDTQVEENAASEDSDESLSRRDDKRLLSDNSETDGIRKSKRIKQMKPVSYSDMIEEYAMSAQVCPNISQVPRSFDDINIRDDKECWKKAVQEELNSHVENNTWVLVDKPQNKNIVDNKWVFVIKTDELGNPLRYKARLVARGFTQQYPFDYEETFAPVARISSFRLIIAFANQFKLIVHHMDVKTAFLNGVLKEDIYMKIPPGLNCDERKVCKLNKAIYGLRQAARCWFEAFENILKEKGFRSSDVDRCIYILDKGKINENIYVLLYVDDVVIATENINTLINFKNFLETKFKMTDLGEIRQFIGIRVERNNDTILLSQSAYIKNILRKFNMENCNAVKTPLPSKLDYEKLNSDENCNAPCRSLIGCLMYVMLCTRPDLSTAVNILSRYSNKNNIDLWQCLKQVLRYLKGTIELKLKYESCNFQNIVTGYVDSDWGGGEDRKSTTGYLFKLFDNCTISWNTRKQMSVAASSMEAEYMALFEAVREAIWLRSLCNSLNLIIDKEIIIFEDNQGCISIANNPTSHKRSKHIDIKYHFTREKIENKIIKLEYICTKNQIADIFTKPLPAFRYLELRDELGMKM